MPQIVFDFGGVLVDWKPQKIVQSMTSELSLQADLMQGVFGHSDWLALDKGSINEQVGASLIAKRMNLDVEVIQTLFNVVRQCLTPRLDTVALLDQLVSQNLTCYGLTNMSMENYAYLSNKHDFFSLFKGTVVSAQEKLIKPDKEIFERLLNRFDLVASETIFIDDTLVNIQAASELGLNCIHFTDAQSCRTALANFGVRL